MATAKTETLTALEVNALTGVETIRNLTTEEIAERESEAAAQATATQAQATARASALAKLAELGLTAEEIAAL